jgi:hypothetical protein
MKAFPYSKYESELTRDQTKMEKVFLWFDYYTQRKNIALALV